MKTQCLDRKSSDLLGDRVLVKKIADTTEIPKWKQHSIAQKKNITQLPPRNHPTTTDDMASSKSCNDKKIKVLRSHLVGQFTVSVIEIHPQCKQYITDLDIEEGWPEEGFRLETKRKMGGMWVIMLDEE